jgi:HK97 gp10 family phage protein
MADMDIEIVTNIEGLDELEEAFTEGSKRAVKSFLRGVEFRAAKPLVDSAKEFAPRNTGTLANEIHRQTVVSDGALTVRVGPSEEAFYGMFQEFGAPEANVKALHWLENSARAVQDEVLEKYYEELTNALEDMKR